MDHNIILFTILVFAFIVFFMRIVTLIAYPVMIITIVLVIAYVLAKKIISFKSNNNSQLISEFDLREEGLTLKYSKLILELRQNYESIKKSLIDENLIGTLFKELETSLFELFNANLDLAKRASQTENYLQTININNLKFQKKQFEEKIFSETDPKLKKEYENTLSFINEAILSYVNCENFLKLIDLEIIKSKNFFDIVKLKFAKLYFSKNSNINFEINELCQEINKLYDDIQKLKNNFSQLKLEFFNNSNN